MQTQLLDTPDDASELWPTAQVRKYLGGVSHMFIQRRLGDDPDFPAPIFIAKRRYWRSDAILNWVRLKSRAA
jgi:hypothetical protein